MVFQYRRQRIQRAAAIYSLAMPTPPNSMPAQTDASAEPKLDLRELQNVLLGVSMATPDTAIANTALPAFASALDAAPAE